MATASDFVGFNNLLRRAAVSAAPPRDSMISRGVMGTINNKLSRARQCQYVPCGPTGGTVLSAVMEKDNAPSLDGMADRIRLLRVALGYDYAEDFAGTVLGIEPNRYRHWERGSRRPNAECLAMLHEATGVSVDWILFGDARNLPAFLVERLGLHPVR